MKMKNWVLRILTVDLNSDKNETILPEEERNPIMDVSESTTGQSKFFSFFICLAIRLWTLVIWRFVL